MENEQEQQEEQQKVDELLNLDPNDATSEQVAEMQKISKSSFEQKKSWRGKATDPATGKTYRSAIHEANIKAKEGKDPNSDKEIPPTVDSDDLAKDVASLKDSDNKRTFGHDNELSPEETDIVFAQAKGSGKTPDDALKSSFVKSGLEAMRKDKSNADATPGTSSNAPKVGGKAFHDMDDKEQEANFSAIVDKSTGRKR